MELRELVNLDVSQLSPSEAGFVCNDIRAVLLDHDVPAVDKEPLRSKLVEAQRKFSGPPPDPRAEILKRITDAEARGDQRLADSLKESVIRFDEKRIKDEARKAGAAAALQAQVEADNKAVEKALAAERDTWISNRAQELLYAHGGINGYDLSGATTEATIEADSRPGLRGPA